MEGSRTVTQEHAKEWVVASLDVDEVPPHGIVEIIVEFDEGAESLIPRLNEEFGAYDLDEAARYIFYLSNRILKGGSG